MIKTIYFSEIYDEYINLKSITLNDPAGNNNDRADYGESLFLNLTVSNLGLTGADGLYATIESSSEWLTIVTDSVFIGTLNSKTDVLIDNILEIKIADLIRDNSYAGITVKLKDSKSEKSYLIDINLHAPVLDILNCTIDDSLTGNGNFFAEPGETVKLVFKIINSGSSDISGTFRILNSPAEITVIEPIVNTGILEYGKTALVSLEAQISPTVPDGSDIQVSTQLDCDPYISNKDYTISIGNILESFEYQSFDIFPWNNISSHPWIITDDKAVDGQFSARSAYLTNVNNTESALSIRVNVPYDDTVRFMCNVSSENNYDFLYFKLNGTQVFKMSGESGWLEKEAILKEGFNLLEWIYKKDESVSKGSDCGWLDYLIFPSAAFNTVDLKTGEIVTPQPGKSYQREVITAQVINFGTDTVRSFNLAYTVNGDIPVSESFSKTIPPGDTVTVAFSTDTNLSGDGSYLIKVFGFSNNDGYLKNDTTSLLIVNTDITSVENPGNKISVMPNPFLNTFRISFESDIKDDVTISIFNSLGKLLWEENAVLTPGENIITVTPENIPPGFYTLRIKGKLTHKAARIIKTG